MRGLLVALAAAAAAAPPNILLITSDQQRVDTIEGRARLLAEKVNENAGEIEVARSANRNKTPAK